jgi:RNA polymerase sigma-70 factor (ECF subfamily)
MKQNPSVTPLRAVDAPEAGLSASLSDQDVVERVRAGDTALFEILIRRHNERIYRTARAVTGSEDEAEDVMQETYVRAFHGLPGFRGEASFSTWLTRIAVNEALARRRAGRRLASVGSFSIDEELIMAEGGSPEDEAARGEMARIVGVAIDGLPEESRLVIALRDIQGLSTRETAATLELTETNVKVRLHRARRELRQVIERRLGSEIRNVYSFHLARCNRVVLKVFNRLGSPTQPPEGREPLV